MFNSEEEWCFKPECSNNKIISAVGILKPPKSQSTG